MLSRLVRVCTVAAAAAPLAVAAAAAASSSSAVGSGPAEKRRLQWSIPMVPLKAEDGPFTMPNFADFSDSMTMTAKVEIDGSAVTGGTLIATTYEDDGGQKVRGAQSAPSTPPFGDYAGMDLHQITVYANPGDAANCVNVGVDGVCTSFGYTTYKGLNTGGLKYVYQAACATAEECAATPLVQLSIADQPQCKQYTPGGYDFYCSYFTVNANHGSVSAPIVLRGTALAGSATTPAPAAPATTTAPGAGGPRFDNCEADKNTARVGFEDLPAGACCSSGGQCANTMCDYSSWKCEGGVSGATTTLAPGAPGASTPAPAPEQGDQQQQHGSGDQTPGHNAPANVEYVNQNGEVVGPATDANFGFWYNANLQPKSITVQIQI